MARERLRLVLILLPVLLPLMACGGLAVPRSTAPAPFVQGKPSWHCPTPSPVRVTEVVDWVMPTEVITTTLPTATPYYRGASFFLGQDVLSGGLRVTVWGVQRAGAADTAGGGIVHLVDVELESGSPLPLDLAAQVVIREVRRSDGTGPRGVWRSDSVTQARAGDPLPTELQPATPWRGRVAIRTPEGTPTLLYLYRTLDDARNANAITDGLLVFDLTGPDPWCNRNVARQPLPGSGRGVDGTPIALPPGTNALVAWAVAHLGYPYVWGAKGPNAFDCSGFTSLAYASIGLIIPLGTTGAPPPGQSGWGTAISTSAVRPGDLLFFHTTTGPPPTHVGMYVGDLDGDGRGDMIHAGSPATGVSFVSDVFGVPFYVNHFWSARRMPGFPY